MYSQGANKAEVAIKGGINPLGGGGRDIDQIMELFWGIKRLKSEQ